MSNETAPEAQEPQNSAETAPSVAVESDSVETVDSPAVQTNEQRAPRTADELSPEERELAEANATPAVVRKAPKFKAFFLVATILGIVIGFSLGLIASEPHQPNRGIYITVCVLFATLMTCLFAGAIALWLDGRSIKRAEAAKKAIG